MIRAQGSESICARYIRSSKHINHVLGTGAQIISGWRLYVLLSASFAHVAVDRRSCRGLICKKVCPCARPGASKAPATSGGKRRIAARTANRAICSESVLWALSPAQIAAQIAPRAAAAPYRRSTAVNELISAVCQHGFRTDCEVRFSAYIRSSNGVKVSVSTGSTLFSGLASLCANRAPVSAGRRSRGALCGPHMQKPVLPVLPGRQQIIHN